MLKYGGSIMVTLEHINSSILSNIGDLEKQILIDFINSFSAVFPNVMSQEELLNRLNKLKYIGFENDGVYGRVSRTADAHFDPTVNAVLLSNKHKTTDLNKRKSLLYHELIHAISRHSENDLDLGFNDNNQERTGLDRTTAEFMIIEKGEEEGILEEIMTEYYNTLLLQYENIVLGGEHTLESNCSENDYVEYRGTGYQHLAGLGQIYDFLFGDKLKHAKFIDGNEFRKNFNDFFSKTGIFDELYQKVEMSPYAKFVAQTSPNDRYKTACKMFVAMLKNNYSNQEFRIEQFLNDKSIAQFMSMLIRTRNKFDKTDDKVKNELFLLMQQLEFDLVKSFNQSAEFQTSLGSSEKDTLIYILYKKLSVVDPTIKLEDINYNNFTIDKFKGIIVNIGGIEYILDTEIMDENLNYTGLQTFKDNISEYSSAYGFDVKDAEYATLYNPGRGYISVIKKDGIWYNHLGQEIELSPSYNLIYGENTRKITSGRARTKKLPSEMSSISAGFISVISLFGIVFITILVTIVLYNVLK